MGLSVVKLFENKTKKKKRMVNYGVISLLQISSRNRFQEFESHKRINLILFLTSSSYFLLQNSVYCAYNADFFPLRTRRFISHANSSHTPIHLTRRFISHAGSSHTPIHLTRRFISHADSSHTPIHLTQFLSFSIGP